MGVVKETYKHPNQFIQVPIAAKELNFLELGGIASAKGHQVHAFSIFGCRFKFGVLLIRDFGFSLQGSLKV